MNASYLTLLAASLALFSGCKPKIKGPLAALHHHEHIPPHHGTPVVLGKEEYHLEIVLDVPTGRIQAYVFDGELENFVRIKQASLEITARNPDREETLSFRAVPNNATGETVGDTSQFEAQADWLKTNSSFDAVLKEVTVRDAIYQNVPFNFPKGNDSDEKEK